MNSEPPENLSQAADAEPILRFRSYIICRFDDGCFMPGTELIDLEVAQAAIELMTDRQRATSVLMPIDIFMPTVDALNYVANEFKKRSEAYKTILESN